MCVYVQLPPRVPRQARHGREAESMFHGMLAWDIIQVELRGGRVSNGIGAMRCGMESKSEPHETIY
jgi:hypothetical protein